MANETDFLQGIDVVAFARKKSQEKSVSGQLIPWQTGLSFDPSRDVDTNATKDGSVTTTASIETDLEVDFTNNTSAIADAMWDSLFDEEMLEVWVVYRKRRNAEGKYFAWYMQATVQEDSNDNDSDDNSNREITFAVNGVPKRGWITLTDEQQEEIDYVFRGLGKITDEDATGEGTAWVKDTDNGTNVTDPATPEVTDPAGDTGDTIGQ